MVGEELIERWVRRVRHEVPDATSKSTSLCGPASPRAWLSDQEHRDGRLAASLTDGSLRRYVAQLVDEASG
jgi:hypothetical protein